MHGFARGKNIQNNAVFADHTSPLRLHPALWHVFAFFPNPYFFIIAKIITKCKGATKKTSSFFFVIFSQQNDNFVSSNFRPLRLSCPEYMYTAQTLVAVAR